MLLLGRQLLKETKKYYVPSLLARIAPVSYSRVEDQNTKQSLGCELNYRTMVTNTRKSTRNKPSNVTSMAMDTDASTQARAYFASLGAFLHEEPATSRFLNFKKMSLQRHSSNQIMVEGAKVNRAGLSRSQHTALFLRSFTLQSTGG